MPINHKQVRVAFTERTTALKEASKQSKITNDMLYPIINKMHVALAQQDPDSRYSSSENTNLRPATISHRSNSFYETWRDLYIMDWLLNPWFGRRQPNVYVTTVNQTNVTNTVINNNTTVINNNGIFTQNTGSYTPTASTAKNKTESSGNTNNQNNNELNGSTALVIAATAVMIVVASVDYVILKHLGNKVSKKVSDPFRKPLDFLKAAIFGFTGYLGYIGGSSTAVFYLGAFASPALVGITGGVLGGILAGGLLYGFAKQVFRLTNYLVSGHTNSTAHLPKAAMLNATVFKKNIDSKKLGKIMADVAYTLKKMGYSNKETNAVIRNPLYADVLAEMAKAQPVNAETPPAYDILFSQAPAYTVYADKTMQTGQGTTTAPGNKQAQNMQDTQYYDANQAPQAKEASAPPLDAPTKP